MPVEVFGRESKDELRGTDVVRTDGIQRRKEWMSSRKRFRTCV